MQFQWYPGHMTKAKRQMQEDIKLIDLIIELVDARIPLSSRNPDIDMLGKNKARLVLMNKADLADPKKNEVWSAYFKEKGYFVVCVDARSRAGMKEIQNTIAKACREKTERDKRRGILNRPVRAMVVGIPNVGKSTFINTYAGKACAKTGNKPGVTKGRQWIRLNRQVELLDTPGILWPKFEDQKTGERLAMIGSISDDILEPQELAIAVIVYLQREYPQLLKERYGLEEAGEYAAGGSDVQKDGAEAADIAKARELLTEICIARRCFQKGETPDISRAARLLLDDFRNGRIGRITIEYPEEWT